MNTHRYHYIEYELLRLALQDTGDGLGSPTSLPVLWAAFRQWLPDVENREIVDALKRLQPQYLTLLKSPTSRIPRDRQR